MPGRSKPWSITSQQWDAAILVVAGYENSTIAQYQERPLKNVLATFSNTGGRMGIVGGLLSTLVLVELGQLRLPTLTAQEKQVAEAYWEAFPSPLGLRLIESYLVNLRPEARRDTLKCEPEEFEELESQIQTTYPLKPQTVRRAVVDWVNIRSFQLAPRSSLVVWAHCCAIGCWVTTWRIWQWLWARRGINA